LAFGRAADPAEIGVDIRAIAPEVNPPSTMPTHGLGEEIVTPSIGASTEPVAA
jgi:hypothetical protein